MEGMEEKLGAILNDPQMIQQIMSMAQSLGQSSGPPREQEKRQEPANPLSQLDPGLLQKLGGMARQGGVDSNEQALLKALGPYLNRNKIAKLENAMRAAKMARLASAFLGSGGLQLLTGR